jgi:hypothetical protein
MVLHAFLQPSIFINCSNTKCKFLLQSETNAPCNVMQQPILIINKHQRLATTNFSY